MDRSAHWTYFIEFVALPPIALALEVFAICHLQWWIVAILFKCGMITWTLLEYWIHRVALHWWPDYLNNQHQVHHQQPKSFIGVTTFGVISAFVMLFAIIALVFSVPISAAFVGGVMICYTVYICIHHHLHHGNKAKFGKWMKTLWTHHATHHRLDQYNFGVSTTVWDRLFGTLRP